MTLQELINLGSHRVRNDNDLMAFYLQEFESRFGRLPNCAGCTFKTDWSKLVQAAQTTKTQNIMTTQNKTFELSSKERNTILTYTNENKQPVRTYGYKMTEEFAVKFLSLGSKKELEERKKLFKKLPKSKQELSIVIDGESVLLSEATGKKLDAYAKEKGIDLGDATKVADKKKIIAKTL